MLGVCIQAGITCPRCDTTVPVNALTGAVRCAACGERLPLDREIWESILEDCLEEAPELAEGEGSRSSIFSSYRMTVTRGRLSPRYPGTKRTIDTELILAGLKAGLVENPEGGEPAIVRPVPREYSDLLPGVKALVGEDPSLAAVESDAEELDVEESSAAPVAFSCPSCGGYLVTDGGTRMAVCDHCGAEASIPDRLWLRLHPALKMRRWYLLLDRQEAPIRWGGDVYDGISDGEGGMVLAAADSDGRPPVLLRLSSDLGELWRRDDVFPEPLSELGNPRLQQGPGGRVLAWRQDCPDLTVLSAEDGSTLRVLRGNDPEGPSDWQAFTMLGCQGLAGYEDSMVLCSGPWRDRDGRRHSRLLRFSHQGEPLPLWPESSRPGLLSRLFSHNPEIGSFPLSKRRPLAFREEGIRLAAGPDGGLFMLMDGVIALYDRDGGRSYILKLPGLYDQGGPCVDSEGNAWVVMHGGPHECAVVRVSRRGEVETVFATDDDDHPMYFASAVAAGGGHPPITAGWNGGLFRIGVGDRDQEKPS